MAGTRLSLPFNGAKLRALRERGGLRQQDLSDKTAESGHLVDRAAISRYENGQAFPHALSFGALVRALKCAPDDLLDNEQAGAA
jgi:transcriptional regulator with XRE-family HTH domain